MGLVPSRLITRIAPDYGTCGIVGLHAVVALLEVGAILAFVADAPEQNGGMGLEGLDHLVELSEVLCGECGVVLGRSRA